MVGAILVGLADLLNYPGLASNSLRQVVNLFLVIPTATAFQFVKV